MPNYIKYSTDSQTLALKSGNFYIGTGDVNKGPTPSTGYWTARTPPASGYTVYQNINTTPSIYVCDNDTDLINLTNTIAGQSYTSATECLVYYINQSDKMCLNIPYPEIVTNGLVLNLDAGFVPSYPRSGTTWSDISLSGNSGTLTNGPTYSTDGGGSIVFDGTNDYVVKNTFPTTNIYCISMWVKSTSLINSSSSGKSLIQLRYSGAAVNYAWYISFGSTTGLVSNEYITIANVESGTRTCVSDGGSLSANTWYNLVFNYENNVYKIYIDNNIKSTVASSVGNVGLLTNPNKLYLSCVDGDGGSIRAFFDGKIAQVSIYNRALSATEILQNYNATKSRFGL